MRKCSPTPPQLTDKHELWTALYCDTGNILTFLNHCGSTSPVEKCGISAVSSVFTLLYQFSSNLVLQSTAGAACKTFLKILRPSHSSWIAIRRWHDGSLCTFYELAVVSDDWECVIFSILWWSQGSFLLLTGYMGGFEDFLDEFLPTRIRMDSSNCANWVIAQQRFTSGS